MGFAKDSSFGQRTRLEAIAGTDVCTVLPFIKIGQSITFRVQEYGEMDYI